VVVLSDASEPSWGFFCVAADHDCFRSETAVNAQTENRDAFVRRPRSS
jgi:hypothetical protein